MKVIWLVGLAAWVFISSAATMAWALVFWFLATSEIDDEWQGELDDEWDVELDWTLEQ